MYMTLTPAALFPCASVLQVLTKAGVLNVPVWWEAGKVSAEQTGIPTRECHQQQQLLLIGSPLKQLVNAFSRSIISWDNQSVSK
jgi:hypothetical protein